MQILIWDSLNAVIVEASKPFCDTQGDRRRGMLHAPVFEKEASELMKGHGWLQYIQCYLAGNLVECRGSLNGHVLCAESTPGCTPSD